MIKRIFPWPVLSGFLLVMWLLLNQTVAVGQVLLGVILAIVLPLATASLRPLRTKVGKPGLMLRLFCVVFYDCIQSNLTVAWTILGSKAKRNNSAFVKIPLDLRDPHGLAVLAVILTAVPGTVWSELSEDRDMLTIHVLDLTDETTSIRTIKDRYEKPLMEIFG
jgi:multicomponent K+:H+ antiporter subunit E